MLRNLIRIGDLQIQSDDKTASLTLPAFCLDISVHRRDDSLGNGHSKPCSLYSADLGIIRPGKRYKNIVKKIRVHSDTVILHSKDKACRPRRTASNLLDFNDDPAPVLGVLYSVRYQIDQHLPDPPRVTDKISVDYIHSSE